MDGRGVQGYALLEVLRFLSVFRLPRGPAAKEMRRLFLEAIAQTVYTDV